MNRYKSRQQAFEIIFENLFKNVSFKEIAEAREEELSEYANDILKNVEENLTAIDLKFEKHLKKWDKNRISKVVFAVLRLAICEMLYLKVTSKIAINEAVELAKKFGNIDDGSFVNGILASVHNDIFQDV